MSWPGSQPSHLHGDSNLKTARSRRNSSEKDAQPCLASILVGCLKRTDGVCAQTFLCGQEGSEPEPEQERSKNQCHDYREVSLRVHVPK